ncbi:MAG: ribosome biogenesis GTPase Der [Desulfobacteraceae bacterium]|nr:ribosome biogenesis GTPase Der [Desulfobacteraceae bacterium]
MKPIVAIIGRPNAGKSTFFNRVTRSKDALVDDWPGVTRDRHFKDARWNDTVFTLVDTGGFSTSKEDAFSAAIRLQIEYAIEDADAIILLLDGKSGVSPFDNDMIKLLRGIDKPVYYVINKIDGPEKEGLLSDFYTFGLSTIYGVSAEHGYGVADLLDRLVESFPEQDVNTGQEVIRLAVVGRPNVGKSSLINKLIGQERHVVSNIPGTTRDAIDSLISAGGKDYVLVDTAGIRRKGRVSRKLEKFSIIKSLRTLDKCHVALIVIDASEGITEQDISIAGYAHERGCGCIFLLNKWDIVSKDTKTVRQFGDALRMSAKFLSFAPYLTMSALTGLRLQKIFGMVNTVYEQYITRIGTGELNRIIEAALQRTEPSLHQGRRLKFYYTTQVSTKPPTFVCFVNHPGAVHFSYKRYLLNQIREKTRLDKVPLRIIFRQRTGKIDFGKRKKNRKK